MADWFRNKHEARQEWAREAVKVAAEEIAASTRKVAMFMPVSVELLHQHIGGLPEPTPEERARWEVAAEKRRAHRIRLAEALATAPDPLSWIAAQHAPSPNWFENAPPFCRGCDFGGMEAEPPEWPCSTAVLIGELLGIDDDDAWD